MTTRGGWSVRGDKIKALRNNRRPRDHHFLVCCYESPSPERRFAGIKSKWSASHEMCSVRSLRDVRYRHIMMPRNVLVFLPRLICYKNCRHYPEWRLGLSLWIITNRQVNSVDLLYFVTYHVGFSMWESVHEMSLISNISDLPKWRNRETTNFNWAEQFWAILESCIYMV